jgi:hypothetical protein
MAEINKIYDDAARATQVYPQTHERAVVDNNGTTAETKFQMISDLVNQKQMEVGAVPSDLTPTEGSTNWVTSGGIKSALTANNISYDNSQSGLAAENVQGALDELSNNANSSENDIDGIKAVISYSDAGDEGWQTIDFSTLTHINKIVSSGGEWEEYVPEPNAIDGVIIPIEGAQKIRLENASNGGGVYVFLKSPTLTFVDFSSQNNSRNVLPSGESIEITGIAVDSLYIYVNLKNATVRINNVEFYYPSTVRRSIRLDALDEFAEGIGDVLDIQYREEGYEYVDFSDYPILDKNIDSNLEWVVGGEEVKSCIIDLTGVSKVNLVNNTNGNCVYVFLTRDDTTIVYASSQNPTSRNVLLAGDSVEVQVANDSKFLFVNYYNQTPRISTVSLYYVSIPSDSKRITSIEQRLGTIQTEFGIEDNPTLTEKEWDANYNIRNIEKVAWTWWFYPQLVIDSRVHNHTWVGYTDEDGFAGLVNFNPSQYTGRKVALKWSNDSGFGYLADDHNNALAYMLDDGRMVGIYASGHEYDNNVYVRVADNNDNYKFSTIKTIEFGGKTTYIQVIKVGTKFFMICRCTNSSNYSWQYTISEDNMATWSSPSTLIVGTTARYYVKLREVKDNSNIIRMVAYGHPTQSSDNSIRMGFIDFSNNAIYNSDGTTQIGTLGTPLSYTALNVIIPSVANKSMRLLDVAITNKNDYAVVYGVWTSSIKTDGIYKVATSNGIKDVVACGKPFWTPSVYLNGATFLNEGNIVLSRNDGTRDFIEIYTYGGDNWVLSKTIHSEVCGTIPIKNIRPIVDKGGNMIAWQRGKFVDTTHTGDFSLDMKLYDVNQDRIII